jgi:cytochrome c-type biogenesis protein CcmH
MTRFIVIAALMAALAAAAVAVPLLRHRRSRVIGMVAALLVVGAAAALYPLWSNYDWQAGQQAGGAPDVNAMVAKLAAHLREQPDDQKGWTMLGRSYSALERPEDALQAYRHAYDLGKSAEAALGIGEALSMQAGGEITAQAAQFFEEGLQLEPTNPKGLLYGGLAAEARGDKTLARSRWQALKDLNPPPQIMDLLTERIAKLDEGGGTAPSPPGTNPSTPDTAPAQVTVKLSIAAALQARLTADAPLFVFARLPGQPGPPLAVKRLTAAAIGSEVRLASTDSMVPGHGIANGQHLSITARVSFSGQPTPVAGDLYGETAVDVGSQGIIGLEINKVAE